MRSDLRKPDGIGGSKLGKENCAEERKKVSSLSPWKASFECRSRKGIERQHLTSDQNKKKERDEESLVHKGVLVLPKRKTPLALARRSETLFPTLEEENFDDRVERELLPKQGETKDF